MFGGYRNPTIPLRHLLVAVPVWSILVFFHEFLLNLRPCLQIGPHSHLGASGSPSVVESQQPAEVLGALDGAAVRVRLRVWAEQNVALALVISLAMVVIATLLQRAAQVCLSEQDKGGHTSLMVRTNRSANPFRFGLALPPHRPAKDDGDVPFSNARVVPTWIGRRECSTRTTSPCTYFRRRRKPMPANSRQMVGNSGTSPWSEAGAEQPPAAEPPPPDGP